MGTTDKTAVEALDTDAPGEHADNAVASALAFARRHAVPTLLDLGEGVRVASMPPGVRLASVKVLLDEYRTKPERLRGRATLETLAAFTAHVQRFKDAGSALFARVGASPSLTAVYDYHRGPSDGRFGDHRAVYQFPLSREWTAWKGIDGKAMEQAAFASWLEDHAADVVDPTLPEVGSAVDKLRAVEIAPATPTQVLTLSRGVELRVESSVASKANLANGSTKLLFDEAVKEEVASAGRGTQLKLRPLPASLHADGGMTMAPPARPAWPSCW